MFLNVLAFPFKRLFCSVKCGEFFEFILKKIGDPLLETPPTTQHSPSPSTQTIELTTFLIFLVNAQVDRLRFGQRIF